MAEAILMTGKRGEGKSLFAVHKIREYLAQGRIVATNLNIDLSKLTPAWSKAIAYRIPDFPTATDLIVCGLGNPNPTHEEKNGLLVLDEAGAFLNARMWQERKEERQELIAWLLQSRKYGWDLLMIGQSVRLIDAQVRDSLFEFIGRSRRLDKVAIPFITRLASIIGFKLRFPRMHIVTLRYGTTLNAPVAEQKFFRGTDLYSAYDTLQKINPDIGVKNGEGYTWLSHWHIKGRYLSWWAMNRRVLISALFVGIVIGVAISTLWHHTLQFKSPKNVELITTRYAEGLHGIGFFLDGRIYKVALSDGRVVSTTHFRETLNGWEAQIDSGEWVKGGN